MAQRKPGWRILPLLTLLLLGSNGGASAQGGERRAGLVLQFADGSTKTYCVAFTEESISGQDLLLKTGLDVRVESFGGAGAMVCKIGPDGCDFPEEACACHSYGPGGVYWSYFHLKEGRWATSGVGVSTYRLRDGDVDGLAWSAGKPPPLFTFSQVCGIAQVEPTTVAQPTATRRPSGPVPTRLLPTLTPRPPLPEATREPTLPPTATRPRATVTIGPPSATPRTTVRATGTTTTQRVPPVATSTSTTRTATATTAATSTPAPTASPTPEPTGTATPQPTTPVPASTDTALPTRGAVTATPVVAVIDARSDTGETAARNIALGIGLATLAGLLGWGIWRGRRKRGPDVD